MITSSVLKTAALGWLRYGKRMPVVCTEVGRWNADVIGVSPQEAIEVEVKVSKADLRAEFRNKRAKHFLYANAQEKSIHVPNRFYILVPAHLGDDALEIVQAEAPKAGLLALEAEGAGPYHRGDIRVLKKAEKLKDTPPSRAFLVAAMMRCSSELCGLHVLTDESLARIEAAMRSTKDDVGTLVARAAGILDVEEPVDDLELRAQELAFCVEGIVKEGWKALSTERRQYWLNAAKRHLEAQYVNAKGWVDETYLY